MICVVLIIAVVAFAFNALTLLCKLIEKDMACKNLVMRCWHGNLSAAGCK